MAYELEIILAYRAFAKASQLWELAQLSPALMKFEVLSPIIDGFTGRKLKVENITSYLSKARKQESFCIEKNEGEHKDRSYISHLNLSDWHIARLDIVNFDQLIAARDSWLPNILNLDSFVHARLINSKYNSLQNMTQLQRFEILGIDHSKLPKKNNGLPFPLNAEIVDTSNNPGRWNFKPGYIEAVGSEMWLGKRFFDTVKLSKEELLASDFFQTKQEHNVIYLKAYDKPFDSAEGKQAEIQNKLRHCLFSKA